MLGIDLFCGGGGMTYGLECAGIRVVRGVDIEPAYRGTYTRNNPGAEYVIADIGEGAGSLVPESIRRRPGPLVMSASPPCQPFSALNRHAADPDLDPRAGMSRGILGAVRAAAPEYVIVENVPAYRNSRDWRELRLGLEDIGYAVSVRTEDMGLYGVPQRRVRFVGIATTAPWCFAPAAAPGYAMTVRDAIGGMADAPDHAPARHIADMMRLMPRDGGTIYDIPHHMRPPCRRRSHRRYSHSRLHWDRPAPTVTAKYDIGSARSIHPEYDRLLNVAERARLQTFPDGYFVVSEETSRRACHRMIGNAVPPLYAFRLGRAVLRHFHDGAAHPEAP